MPAPTNLFKAKIQQGIPQIGCWAAMTNAYSTEILGTCGFDWVLIDGEHAPNDIGSILSQLQALASSASHPVVRLPEANETLVKQALDIGVQSLLIPMIENAEQAKAMVQAIYYPPKGRRGVGSALARASEFSKITDYLQTANEQICLLLQVESTQGITALTDILSVDGVDGVFLGPSDLAADMGYVGQANHPTVREVIFNALTTIEKSGKARGLLSLDPSFCHQCLKMGTEVLAVGIDVVAYSQSLRQLSASFIETKK